MSVTGLASGLVYNTLKADDVLKVDNTLKTLIPNAAEEFGFALCDVYNGVLNPSNMKRERANAREGLNWSGLQTFVQTFSRTRELSGLSSLLSFSVSWSVTVGGACGHGFHWVVYVSPHPEHSQD